MEGRISRKNLRIVELKLINSHQLIYQFAVINQCKIYDLMLCGDFNIDLLECNIPTSFQNTMYSLSLMPIISKPTRIADNSATLIDNFFINEPCTFESGILISDISDHFPIFFVAK